MKNLIKTFLNDEAGASAAEYALILAIIGTGVAVGAVTLGDAIGNALSRAGSEIDTLDYSGA
ncbi:Flp family type IVb pilin [Porphyrobacter sp. LM 6]|uniref:Flp family type IVb pilin n=1 Tax=Porphyrobacter sp. LM 6 TaxID=1896196 RepID=UPI000847786F|nr:Flp family type IVb pilin [Porphyrobacter sp. LM 6]AOL93186.1 pilus assembly protein Flp/PilA [Porphyrobacter sp. LM 6]